MILEKPSEKHRNEYNRVILDWSESEKIPVSPRRLFYGANFDEFLNRVTTDATIGNDGMQSSLFFGIVDNSIIGAIHLRHHINHPDYASIGGHVGYGVVPRERGKGYASEMLKLVIPEASKLGIKDLLIICDEDNIGSRRVIEYSGGIFEKEINHNGVIMRRYWINV